MGITDADDDHQEVFLPMTVQGQAVLEYIDGSNWRVDNAELRATCPDGLSYRQSKQLDDKLYEAVEWGIVVKGTDTGDGWLQTKVIHGGCEPAAAAVEDPANVVLRVTDQPGLMDKSGNFMDLADGVDAESARALAGEHQNGYHVLFLVQKITDRLDAGEQAILRIVRRFYGESVLRRIVLLLTYSDVADTDEEISNMIMEAKADVETAVGGDIACAIPINNRVSRVDLYGKDRLMSGREMACVILHRVLR